MSDTFYGEIDEVAIELLTEFGTMFTVTTPGSYNHATLGLSPPSTRQVLGLVSTGETAANVSSLQGTGNQVSNATSQWVTRRTLLIASSANVQRNETIEVNGVSHSLERVEEIRPADRTVLYILDLTK